LFSHKWIYIAETQIVMTLNWSILLLFLCYNPLELRKKNHSNSINDYIMQVNYAIPCHTNVVYIHYYGIMWEVLIGHYLGFLRSVVICTTILNMQWKDSHPLWLMESPMNMKHFPLNLSNRFVTFNVQGIHSSIITLSTCYHQVRECIYYYS
jgi:hypothetical protein